MTDGYLQKKNAMEERDKTPGIWPCTCKWQRTYQISWRKNPAGLVQWWAEMCDHVSCRQDNFCVFDDWTVYHHGSKTGESGRFGIIKDKCKGCKCGVISPDVMYDCEYLLGSTGPFDPKAAGYVNPKTLPASVALIVKTEGSDSGILAAMIADLRAAGETEAPSDSVMASICRGETSVNAI